MAGMKIPATDFDSVAEATSLWFGSAEGQGTPVSSANPLPVTMIPGGYPPSSVAAVTATLSSVSASSTFAPILNRPFNATHRRTSDFAGSYQLERKFADDATWYVVLAYADLVDLPETFSLTETEAGVTYRWSMTVCTAGSVNVRISA